MKTPILAVMLVAGFWAAADAQPQTPPRQQSRGEITRDEYIQHASQAAAPRFDEIDTQHTGVLTRQQIRAWTMQHRRRAPPGGHGGPPDPGQG